MTNRRASVIGAGFGGLALAIRLQARGVQTTIFEKRAIPGGRAYQFREAGYTFDMGPSLITAPDIVEGVFAAAGRKLRDYVDLIPLEPFYRIYYHDGSSIDYTSDAEAMKAQIRRFSVRDAERYDAFFRAVQPIYHAVISDGLGSRPFDSIAKMLAFAPRALRLKALKPVATLAEQHFEDFRHQFLFSFHPLFLGGNPFRSPSIYAMIPYLEKAQGVWFARGGMYALVCAMERLFRELGGDLRTGAEVSEIVTDNGRVTAVRVDEDVHPADIVVSNADVAHTYRDLVPSVRRTRWTDRRLRRLHYSMSCFVLYLGVTRQYPALAHHTLILAPRYRELVEDIFERKILPDDFSMYLHAPTRTDASMAPDGCESLYVLVPVPNLAATIRWADFSEEYATRIIRFLEVWGMDDLGKHIEVRRTFTPDDFHAELNAHLGNAFGPEPRLTQTAHFRPHNRSEEVEGLYLVGAGTHPGAGVPGVLLSAEATESCIVEDFLPKDGEAVLRDTPTLPRGASGPVTVR